jgi:pantetheine-phosphate adenylyltransferase
MKVIYPGSFDPVTYGHVDVIVQALHMFKEIDIVVMSNEDKKHKFDIDQRRELFDQAINDECLRGFGKINVTYYCGWISDWLKSIDDDNIIIIRGLRNTTDFDYEMMYEAFTKEFGAQSIYITPNPSNIFTSSSLVRNLIDAGGDYLSYVPWKKLPR